MHQIDREIVQFASFIIAGWDYPDKHERIINVDASDENQFIFRSARTSYARSLLNSAEITVNKL